MSAMFNNYRKKGGFSLRRRTRLAPQKPPQPIVVSGHVVTEQEIREKLNQLADHEWLLFPIVWMPSRLQQ
jgi:hypothetical protein